MEQLQNFPIDYYLLGKAADFYRRHGYKQIEVPWIVEAEYSRMTSPTKDDGVAFILRDDRHLVASAEQGFVQMMHKGELEPDTTYFAVSPCFRDEFADSTHSKWFVKLELFVWCVRTYALDYPFEFAKDASLFFEEQGIAVEREHTPLGIDVVCNGLELGSYGSRRLNDHLMVYGTGVALPRLSLAIQENVKWVIT